MREIKFRAWCKEDREMFQWHEIGIESYNAYVLIPRIEEDKIGHRNWDSDLILMQYTELTDKNGKEMYEGDIVKVYSQFGIHTCRVVWDAPEFRLKDIETGTYMANASFTDETGHEINIYKKYNSPAGFEIIGNIYENPSLLEK